MSAGKTRQNLTKKRSLSVINDHFEEDSNAVLSSAIVLQKPATIVSSKKDILRFYQANLPSDRCWVIVDTIEISRCIIYSIVIHGLLFFISKDSIHNGTKASPDYEEIAY
jgi:hypothetical protein